MSIVKFIVSLTLLIKKNVQPLENIYSFIKIWTFNYGKWSLFS